MNKKALTLIFLTMLAFTLPAQAMENVNIKKDLENNTISLYGIAEPNEHITVQILPEGVSLADFAGMSDKSGEIAFVGDIKADEDGAYSISAVLTDTGHYNAFMCGSSTYEPILKAVSFINSDDYKAAVEYVNGSASKQDFIERVSERAAFLGYDYEVNADIADIAEKIYNASAGQLSETDFDKNTMLYKQGAAVCTLNLGRAESLYDLIDDLIKSDENLLKYWNKHITSMDKEKLLIGKASGKNIPEIKDLKTAIEEALILTVVKEPNGYMNIQEIFSEYNDSILKIGTLSTASGVYSALAGGDYDSISDLTNAYRALSVNTAKDTGNKSSGSGGGNSSTGSGGTVISNSAGVSVTALPSNTEGNEEKEIDMFFDDLASVSWAYTSISRLYKSGIISGVSETKFRPENPIKREEFTKMLVCALGYDIEEGGSTFVDAKDGAWYIDYINTAYKNGLVSGISENEFGVARDITRQDMALMLYNAIKEGLWEDKQVTFADEGEIAAYARQAVSYLAGAGIISGAGDNRFLPTANATRAEAAVIIERAWSYLGR